MIQDGRAGATRRLGGAGLGGQGQVSDGAGAEGRSRGRWTHVAADDRHTVKDEACVVEVVLGPRSQDWGVMDERTSRIDLQGDEGLALGVPAPEEPAPRRRRGSAAAPRARGRHAGRDAASGGAGGCGRSWDRRDRGRGRMRGNACWKPAAHAGRSRSPFADIRKSSIPIGIPHSRR